ncbi:HD domain-containing protein [Actomonas aquatica]|uniref:HD-CE domain-containing protein n=1 Tax=Actomonas aquatica TaxID=2866162 RepID=A0ABZ1CCH0_9BACT|nr:hypothetical protein [Opitutus sp. WL0086]WRQ88299.1 hypothetical protein K1X11_002705 [Opitutus sp. WL0086]
MAYALPRFTLHDATHLNNVLYWMDRLVTPTGLDALGPKGCGLCLLLAYAHDLGMVPETDWEEKLKNENSPESVKLRRFTNERHPDLAGILERPVPEDPAARQKDETIRGHIREFIRTDYLRVTHAEDGNDGRVLTHLRSLLDGNELKQAFAWLCTEETALQLVALLIASHNQSITWLEERLRREFGLERPWTWTAAGAEKVNLLLPCLLLRVADICDFDASRTPHIVFHQLGLEGGQFLGLEKLDGAVGISRGEWHKHLAVDGWCWSGGDGGELVYSAGDCPHPAVHKAIQRFRDEIGDAFAEVERVVTSMAVHGARAWLRIPREVKAEVKARGYTYHDVEFKLQAHEVTELLLGTALYGNPELCIRELLQNALDAVQLRDLRYQLKLKLDDEGRRTDMPPEVELSEGWKKAEREQAKIELTWGRDAASGREWIQVKDRGTGMTLDQIIRYLSALGKSYYKSAEFGAEARLMREHGFIATPISQFGIGLLSCFMIADWMEVRTCPCCRDNDERKAWHVKITGPGALFHFSEWKGAGTPGTEVRLYLKCGFALVDIPREELIEQLRYDLRYEMRWIDEKDRKHTAFEGTEEGVRYINPAAVAARHVIWPHHEIISRREDDTAPVLILDGRWHFEEISPWPTEQVSELIEDDGFSAELVDGVAWRVCDWMDDKGTAATGSRIRVVFAASSQPSSSALGSLFSSIDGGARIAELACWGEKFLPTQESSRQRYLVRGMRVPTLEASIDHLTQAVAGVGAWLWIDLAGKAAPALTADRTKTREFSRSVENRQWREAVDGVFNRWIQWVSGFVSGKPRERNTILYLINFAPRHFQSFSSGSTSKLWHYNEASATFALPLSSLLFGEVLREAERDQIFVNGRTHFRDRDLTWGLDSALNRALDAGVVFEGDFFQDYWRARGFDTELANAQSLALSRSIELSHSKAPFFVFDLPHHNLGHIWRDSLDLNLVNEGFWPDLSGAFPLLSLPVHDGGLVAAEMVAPTVLKWRHAASETSSPRDYDLVFPFSVVAQPSWRSKVPVWGKDRGWRRFLSLPFLHPSSSLAAQLAQVMREPDAKPHGYSSGKEQEQAELDALHGQAKGIAQHTLHVLLPRSDWWERPFSEWSESDWEIGGYTAWWDLPTGKLLWAVGGVRREDMPAKGLPIEDFLKSSQLAAFRRRCPELFPEE